MGSSKQNRPETITGRPASMEVAEGFRSGEASSAYLLTLPTAR